MVQGCLLYAWFAGYINLGGDHLRRPRTHEGSHLGMLLDLPGRAGKHGQGEGHLDYLSLLSSPPTTHKLLKMDGWMNG